MATPFLGETIILGPKKMQTTINILEGPIYSLKCTLVVGIFLRQLVASLSRGGGALAKIVETTCDKK